jgi:tetratricopeptide (TPR) repeat protein
VSQRTDVLLWANRVNAMPKTAQAHQLLEIPAEANLEAAQQAFHRIARLAHPDLHRNHVSADELEDITKAYATVANAYQAYRSSLTTVRMKPIKSDGAVAATPSGAPGVALGAAGAMSSRALVYYRKAELALRRGELQQAIMQLKLAIASDPQSAFLRTALAEVETEVRKGP